MRATTIVLISAIATLGIGACTQEAEPASEPTQQVQVDALENSGPAIGDTIPAEFAVRDQTGAQRGFDDVAGENGLVLVFNRSADWCSYCQAQMIGLRDIQDDLEERGYTLATISYDSPAILSDFAAREEIGYQMLSDEGSAMIDAFDLRDPQYGEDSFANGVPRPAIFVIDTSGTVRAKMVETDYRVRPEPADIVAAVDGL